MNFSVNISPKELIGRLRESSQEYQAELTGNDKNGTIKLELPFVGEFEGTYTFTGQQITVIITKRPFFVSPSICEMQIRKYIKSLDY